jgi:hypothetical protein
MWDNRLACCVGPLGHAFLSSGGVLCLSQFDPWKMCRQGYTDINRQIDVGASTVPCFMNIFNLG